MKRLYRKLKSDNGASLIFALIVFLLCALVGTVALTAASANIGRYKHLEEDQRKYFSVASALELLQAELDKTIEAEPVTVKIVCVETEKWWYEEVPPATSGAEPTYVLKAEKQNQLKLEPDPVTQREKFSYYRCRLIDDNIPAEYKAEWDSLKAANLDLATISNFHGIYSVTPPTAYEDSSLYTVEVEVKNNADGGNYALEMYLKTKDDSYPLKVVWTAEPEITTETKVETTGEVNPALAAPTDPDSTGTRTTTTTITCTLKWSEDNRVVTFE